MRFPTLARRLAALWLTLALAIATLPLAGAKEAPMNLPALDRVAERYVKLVLEVGLYDPDLVDAYFGPPEWRPAPLAADAQAPFPGVRLRAQGTELMQRLEALDTAGLDPLVERRQTSLRAQLVALLTRIDLVAGITMPFDEESLALYGVIAPPSSEAALDDALGDLDRALPGAGELARRYDAFRRQFIVPPDKVEAVFAAAIAEARRRTLAQIALPAGERFTVEQVTGQSWAAYNWYQGEYRSLIQVNTDLPIYLGSVITLAAHEGYPGHHVQNVLSEMRLRQELGWIEYCVAPLFSPLNAIAEGAADYGVEVAFPEREHLAFEREVLFPLAGLDPAQAERYFEVRQVMKRLRYASIEMARRFLDGTLSEAEALAWSMKYELRSREEAERSLRFARQYRSYIVNYAVGEDLVRRYVETHAGRADRATARWRLLTALFTTPHTPADLE